MVQRTGAQVHVHVTVVTRRDREQRARGTVGHTAHTLGPPGRARRVEHGAAEGGILERRALVLAEHVVPALEARNLAADRDLRLQPGCGRRGFLGRGRELRVRDEHRRFAVVDDVARFLPGEVPVDGRQPHAAARRGPRRFHEFGPVDTHERESVARFYAAGAERAHELVRVRVDLGKGAIPVLRVERDPIGLHARPVGPRRPFARRGEHCVSIDLSHGGSLPGPPSQRPECERPDARPAARSRPNAWTFDGGATRPRRGLLRPRRARRTPHPCRPNPRTG